MYQYQKLSLIIKMKKTFFVQKNERQFCTKWCFLRLLIKHVSSRDCHYQLFTKTLKHFPLDLCLSPTLGFRVSHRWELLVVHLFRKVHLTTQFIPSQYDMLTKLYVVTIPRQCTINSDYVYVGVENLALSKRCGCIPTICLLGM